MVISSRAQRYLVGLFWAGALVLAVAAVLTGCATQSTLATSGESLRQVGVQFVAVNGYYVAGCKDGTIKPLDCANYGDFGRKFRAEYPVAVQAWEAARNAKDTAAEGRARDAIAALAQELSAVTVKALQGAQQ